MEELKFENNDCVLFISDVHYGFKSGGANSIKYVEWMENIDKYFGDFFIPLINDYKSKQYNPIVFVAGDFFDTRLNLRVDVMNSGMNLVRKLSDICPVVFLVGNHDSYYEDNTHTNSIEIFRGIPNVYLTNDVTRVIIKNGINFDLISWISNSVEQSKIIKKSTADYLVLHADINGCSYPSKIVISDKVETKGFKGKHIYSGHIHKRQEKGKVTYLGSPYELEWSDSGNVKGIYALRVEQKDDSYEVIEDFTENSKSPKFISYDITEIDKMVKDGVDIDKKLASNYISISYKSDDAPIYKELMNSLTDRGYKGLAFKELEKDIVIDESAVDVPKALSVDDAIIACIDSMDLTKEEKEFLENKHKEYSNSLNY